ncbi:MAG: hypothetical protein J6R40_06045, partial [Clostridia bacterium]|nr:hypothetical protein [Clostridia bacterium]
MFEGHFANILGAYEAFWERTNTKRCILNLSAPLDDKKFRAHESLEEKWLDDEYVCANFKYTVKHSFYTAEGVPMMFTNLGPGCLSACIGGDFTLAPNTIWFDRAPIISDWENPPAVSFDENSPMWEH